MGSCFRCNNSGRAGSAATPLCPVCQGSGDASRPGLGVAVSSNRYHSGEGDREIFILKPPARVATSFSRVLEVYGEVKVNGELARIGTKISPGDVIEPVSEDAALITGDLP